MRGTMHALTAFPSSSSAEMRVRGGPSISIFKWEGVQQVAQRGTTDVNLLIVWYASEFLARLASSCNGE